MERIAVDLEGRPYDICLGQGLIATAGALLTPYARDGRVLIVTDTHVGQYVLPQFAASLQDAGLSYAAHLLPAGEGAKSWAELERLVDWLLGEHVERSDHIIALGGGVVGDITGFAAHIVKRGCRFVQVPTTLLAQVDSSVGGKTAINVPEGKNLVGLFHQPRLVLADTAILATLPLRELKAGYAEIVKYGLIGDAALFDWLDGDGARLLSGDGAALARAVAASVRAKAGVVARDETETGERALLNLGHTFGHALEAATGFSQRLLHGEGVAIGMKLAFDLSAALGLCDGQTPHRVAGHLARMGLPWRLADIPGPRPATDELLHHMAQDKKVEAGKLTFILARAIGEAFVARDVDAEAVRRVLDVTA